MARRKRYGRKVWQRRAGSGEGFVQLHYDLLDSPAFHDLKARFPRAAILYLYCLREAHGQAMRDNPGSDERVFYQSRSSCVGKHHLYAPTDRRGFKRDMTALIEHGFVDCVRSGYATREKNLYALSGRWCDWGTEKFAVPENVMTDSMRAEKNR